MKVAGTDKSKRTMAVMMAIRKPESLSVQDLLADQDLIRDDLKLNFDLSEWVKVMPSEFSQVLRDKQLAMIFEKPSLRTRTTFEVGMTSLGGFAVYLDHTRPRLGEREAIKDMARNLEHWVHAIVARTFSHNSVLELAANASVPVINALTDLFHPCQALADFFTLHEKFGSLKGLKLAFVGDGSSMCHSLMIMGAKLGASVWVECNVFLRDAGNNIPDVGDLVMNPGDVLDEGLQLLPHGLATPVPG